MRNIEVKISKDELKKKLDIRDGKDGARGGDGKDGSPDTPDQVIEKINTSKNLVDAERVRGLAQVIKDVEKIGTNPVGDFGGKTVRYLDGGTEVSQHVTELNFGANLNTVYDNDGRVTVSATAGAGWTYYATTWSVEPTLNTAITGGEVYNYTLDGTTRYRFVPTTYDATQDAFYTTFSNPTLSGLIVARG